MYCVIQKIQNKKESYHNKGYSKELLVDSYSFSMGNNPKTIVYTYKYGEELFDRPHRESYKVSIHNSYRINGKVKKQQWNLGTIHYYELAEENTYDCLCSGVCKHKKEIGLEEEKIWELIEIKLNPLMERAKAEFEATEEYITHKKHKDIIDKHLKAKNAFNKKYGKDDYDKIYDVFGVCRNAELLKQFEEQYKQQQKEYEDWRSSYRGNSYSNYSSNNYSDYFEKSCSNYTDEEKNRLKKIYKTLAISYHPDKYKDDNGETMQLINKLKEEWGI